MSGAPGPAGHLPGWGAWLGAAALGLAGLALLSVWTPSDDRGASLCLLRRWWVPCPGCGMTRAMAHLVRGHWQEALAYHPLAPWLVGEGLLAWVLWGVLRARRRALPRSRWLWGGLMVIHGAVFLAVWIVRLQAGTLPP